MGCEVAVLQGEGLSSCVVGMGCEAVVSPGGVYEVVVSPGGGVK